MICPFAVQKPIDTNHGGAMSAHLGLVVHVQQGNGSLAGYFDNPAAQVSSNFWCGKDGTLEQYLDTDVVAWAEANGNGTYDSCEFEGFDTEAMTAAQIATGARLAKWLSGEYGWPIVGPVAHGAAGVTPHCNPDGSPDPSWGDHPCPGSIRLAQIPGLVAAANGPTPTPSPPIPGDDTMAVSALTGDFKQGQIDGFQTGANALWHKYCQAGIWRNEKIPTPAGRSGAVGEPKWSIIGGALYVVVEDGGAKAWGAVQASNASGWAVFVMP